ncbi:MAG: cell division protein FtsQ [Candidatus Tokpelaia sp. JSC085]|nr:MAG: cell division protein FtsQ [Candidatus Tokpelaia sp. JSC085]
MSALKDNFRQDCRGGHVRFSWFFYKVGRRLYLKAMRILYHLASSFVMVFGISAIFSVCASGYATQICKMAMSIFNFTIAEVDITGNLQTSDIDVLDALGFDSRTSMMRFSVERARAALEALPWVASVSVRKVYPAKISITITERCPVALWQHDATVDIIDREGRIIVPYTPALGRGLPLFVGKGAEHQASVFLNEIQSFSSFLARARAYIRVGERRWDILLDNGIRIKLPEVDAAGRLAAALNIESRFRNIETIDLRLDDRITVSLSDAVLIRHLAAVQDLDHHKKVRKAEGGEV